MTRIKKLKIFSDSRRSYEYTKVTKVTSRIQWSRIQKWSVMKKNLVMAVFAVLRGPFLSAQAYCRVTLKEMPVQENSPFKRFTLMPGGGGTRL